MTTPNWPMAGVIAFNLLAWAAIAAGINSCFGGGA
jgi:hypothetical protein